MMRAHSLLHVLLLQVQDLVPVHDTAATSAGEGDCQLHGSAAHLLSALDVDGDGAVSRRDMLLAFRRDRQLAGACGTQGHPSASAAAMILA
jgi:hypothetical protein